MFNTFCVFKSMIQRLTRLIILSSPVVDTPLSRRNFCVLYTECSGPFARLSSARFGCGQIQSALKNCNRYTRQIVWRPRPIFGESNGDDGNRTVNYSMWITWKIHVIFTHEVCTSRILSVAKLWCCYFKCTFYTVIVTSYNLYSR